MNQSPTQKPLTVSIITPTFNRGDFLEKNILSVKNQDYPFFEHIVIDGLSTDNSVEILKKHEGSYPLRWVSEKDQGYADGLNKGFARATGDVVCWLDSDDFYLPGTLSRAMNIFADHPEVDVVFGNILLADYRGNVIDYVKHTKFDIDTLIYLTMNLNPQATFWRRSVHENVGPLSTALPRCADADFFIRMGLLPIRFHHLNEFLAVYRMHEAQLTKDTDMVKQDGDRLLQRYGNNITKEELQKKRSRLFLKQILNFISQGDFAYVLRGMLRRIIGGYLYRRW